MATTNRLRQGKKSGIFYRASERSNFLDGTLNQEQFIGFSIFSGGGKGARD